LINNRQDTVEALDKLLREVISSSSTYVDDAELRQALTSQGRLAKLSIPEKNIAAISLNTLKVSADEYLGGGFKALDLLRLQALQALNHRAELSQRKPRSKAALKTEVELLKDEISGLNEDLHHITKAFSRALKDVRRYAEASGLPYLREQWAEEERNLRAMASYATRKGKMRLVKSREES
jgi:HPt (histidine-containing phosphotransfer) domain-containing protein